MLLNTMNRSAVMLAVLGLLPLAGLARVEPTEDWNPGKDGVQFIGQVESVAREVQYHADQLNSFNNFSNVSRETHSFHLNQIRSLVNDELRPAMAELTELQPELPPWQRGTVDQLLASSSALAANANSAILAKKEAGAVPAVLNAEYKELISKVYEHSTDLVQTSDAAGNFANAHREALEAGLDLPNY